VLAGVLAEATAGKHQAGSQVETLTVKQAAERLNVSADLIYDLCQGGKLRHQKIGRTIRIRPADLDCVDTTPKTKLRCLTI
jgi:excisionase family DNA binding protein